MISLLETYLVMVRSRNENDRAISRDVKCSPWSYFTEEDVYNQLPEEEGCVINKVGGRYTCVAALGRHPRLGLRGETTLVVSKNVLARAGRGSGSEHGLKLSVIVVQSN